jgi:hypothetical protein
VKFGGLHLCVCGEGGRLKVMFVDLGFPPIKIVYVMSMGAGA